MTNTGIYQWFCLWRWWKMSNSGCVFFFLCVLPQRQANFVKMPLPPRMHLWEPICLFPQRRAFFTRWLATQLKQVIMLSMCESPLPICFEIFLCVGIPQHYGLQRNVSHGTLLLPLGSREQHLSTSKKKFHLGFYPQKQMLRQFFFL